MKIAVYLFLILLLLSGCDKTVKGKTPEVGDFIRKQVGWTVEVVEENPSYSKFRVTVFDTSEDWANVYYCTTKPNGEIESVWSDK